MDRTVCRGERGLQSEEADCLSSCLRHDVYRDTSIVIELLLFRLHDAGVCGRLWRTIAGMYNNMSWCDSHCEHNGRYLEYFRRAWHRPRVPIVFFDLFMDILPQDFRAAADEHGIQLTVDIHLATWSVGRRLQMMPTRLRAQHKADRRWSVSCGSIALPGCGMRT